MLVLLSMLIGSKGLLTRFEEAVLTQVKPKADHEDRKVLSCFPLFCLLEGQSACRLWDLGSKTHPCKASIEESQFLRLGNRGRYIP